MERFPGYTLGTLLAEDASLIRLLLIEERGTATDGQLDRDHYLGQE